MTAAVRFIEQRARVVAHHQQRHQVLEHRRAPRQQCTARRRRRQRPPELEPVLLRHLARGDGDEAGQPRLGRQHVVVGAVEATVGDAVADREQLPIGDRTGSRTPPPREDRRRDRTIARHDPPRLRRFVSRLRWLPGCRLARHPRHVRAPVAAHLMQSLTLGTSEEIGPRPWYRGASSIRSARRVPPVAG